MCVKKKDESGFKFICTHRDGTNITFNLPSDMTWHELGEHFRCFVLACGYSLDKEDCCCNADRSDIPLIDDIPFDGAPT